MAQGLIRQDLIAEDMVPLRQVSIEEIEPRIREEAVSLVASDITPTALADRQQRKEREGAVRDRVLGSLGFVTEGQEGDAY